VADCAASFEGLGRGKADFSQPKTTLQSPTNRCIVYITVMDRTNIYLSKPQKAALQKLAKQKGISVAELVRRILDKELDREQKQKG
jgi:fructose-1,6-bisphosphatase/sedoheptulose 1,7-bisphosphatase-like protein